MNDLKAHEIKCPKCGEVFQVDEASYATIVMQVRDAEYNKDVATCKKQMEEEKALAVELAVSKEQKAHQDALTKKEQQLTKLQAEIETQAEKHKAEIAGLEAKINNADLAKQLEIKLAESAKDEVIRDKENEITQLKGKLTLDDATHKVEVASLKDKYEEQLKEKNELIDYYKDLKTRMSTKMLGETLEQHCQNSFNACRALSYPYAYFDKDNKAVNGSKGDYIFRDRDSEGTEYISIMFEMKNEADTTATKKKNEDFFKELDKDRRDKGCEYAVLVSMLEADSELYNQGIVDVSYRYPKMFVVRPQFFLPIIQLLSTAAKDKLDYIKREDQRQREEIDLVNFNANLADFKLKFGKHYKDAQKKFNDSIDEIDKVIKLLEKVKEDLTKSGSHLSLANKKAEDLTLKKLASKSPSLKAKLKEQNIDASQTIAATSAGAGSVVELNDEESVITVSGEVVD